MQFDTLSLPIFKKKIIYNNVWNIAIYLLQECI